MSRSCIDKPIERAEEQDVDADQREEVRRQCADHAMPQLQPGGNDGGVAVAVDVGWWWLGHASRQAYRVERCGAEQHRQQDQNENQRHHGDGDRPERMRQRDELHDVNAQPHHEHEHQNRNEQSDHGSVLRYGSRGGYDAIA